MSHGSNILETLLSVLGLIFLGWLGYGVARRSAPPTKFIFQVLLTLPLLAGEFLLVRKLGGSLSEGAVVDNFVPVLLGVLSILVAGVLLSILWTPILGELLASPLTNLFDGGSEPPESKPAYSAALFKRKARRPLEAIVAIREQLAKFPHDFAGVMLLANIQAEDLDDLAGAEITLNCFCESPNAPDPQVVKALTQLADWHLNRAADEDSALAVLRKLMARFPDAEISRRLAQRLMLANGGVSARIELSRLKSKAEVQNVVAKTRR